MRADPRPARRRSMLVVAFAAAVMATAACGSTVPITQQAAQPDSLSGLPGTAQSPGSVTSAVDGVSAGPGAAPSALAADRPSDGVAPGGVTTGSPAGGQQQPRGSVTGSTGGGRGVTDTTITIGAMTSSGAAQYQRTLGFDQGASGDQIAMVRSVVNWLNSRGGIAGRRIKLVVYDVPTTSAASNPTAAYEAACSAFTEDNEVFAVASILSHVTPNFYECLRKHGVPVVTANAPLSSRFFTQFDGTVYAPTNPSYTRVLNDSVEALWAEGWLTSTSKVGVVGFDTPDAHATVDDGLVPALRRHGLKVTADFYTSEDASGSASAYSGGVLQFKAAGVDRVFFAPGGQPIFFALAAQQQDYRPFLEMSTLEYPDPVANTLPEDALTGAAGIGWSPYLDLEHTSAAKVGTPAKDDCIKAVEAARQDLSTGTTFAIATWICDGWFFLRDGLAKAPTITRLGFQSAVDGLGSSFRAANTFKTFFAPNRTSDGAAAYRLMKYDRDCRCFRYSTGERPLS